MNTQPRILVLGAGFGALAAVRELRRARPEARIAVLAPKAEFVYLPSLIWVPTGLRTPEALRVPLAAYFARQGVEFIQGSVEGLSEDARVVHSSAGKVPNDALVIATGGRFLRKLPGIEHALTVCEGLDAATRIRDRLAALRRGRIAVGFGANPKEPSAVRGGPMFELLFGIDTWLRRQGRRQDVGLDFFNGSATPGQRLGAKAVAGMLDEMRRRDIGLHLGYKPKAFSETGVDTEDEHIPADLILFMPGLTGPAWLDNTALPRSPGGFVQADAHCAVPGLEHVFVVGDAGSYPGPDWMPKQAHMAEIQARAVSRNVLDSLAGRPVQAVPKTELLCIVDSLGAGSLIYRSESRNVLLPSSRLWHWAKRLFEGRYLRGLR